MRLLIATSNRHKLRELRELLKGCGLDVVGLDAFPGAPEVVEDGATLDANARKKAMVLAAYSGVWALADDSGLEVAALDGAPGVYSARYAGPACDAVANVIKLMTTLEGVSDRRACFRCVIAIASPDGGFCHRVEGRCDGRIAEVAAGEGGFGYDPVFIPDGETLTFAQMQPEQKHGLSHRGRALRAARAVLGDLAGS